MRLTRHYLAIIGRKQQLRRKRRRLRKSQK